MLFVLRLKSVVFISINIIFVHSYDAVMTHDIHLPIAQLIFSTMTLIATIIPLYKIVGLGINLKSMCACLSLLSCVL